MPDTRVQLHGDLVALVRRRPVSADLRVPVPSPRSVKDAVESLGVPHTEAGAVVVDDAEVGWDARLHGGEHVHVHPVGCVPADLVGRVRPDPPARPLRLVADVHLGTLARWLRVLGVDTWWRNDADDDRLATVAVRDQRVLLTRDRQLLMRSVVHHGALVRHDAPDEQLAEVARRLLHLDDLAPGSRCPACNGDVEVVDASEVTDRLEPGTRAAGHRQVGRCRRCDRLYWPGAHADAVAAIVDRARTAVRPSAAGRPGPRARPRRGSDAGR